MDVDIHPTQNRSNPYWILEEPENPSLTPLLAIICGDWAYGILPYCGPGDAQELWKNEGAFLYSLSTYLNQQGIYTLRLSSYEDGMEMPDDDMLSRIASPTGVIAAIKNSSVSWSPSHMILIGHGLGGYVNCQLASFGIRPAGFIFAGAIYSELQVIISQKFLPVLEIKQAIEQIHETLPMDFQSLLIAKNMGLLFNAIRKKRSCLRICEGDQKLEIHINRLLFSGSENPKQMFRFIASPSLIIHGSSDLDVSVWNATSIEQSIHQTVQNVERVVIEDCDHWFRTVPDSITRHQVDRITGASFAYEPDTRFFSECLAFIKQISETKEIIKPALRKNSVC